MVLDADGLNCIANHIHLLKEKSCDIIITPHPGEMSRLTGLTVKEISANPQKVAEDFSREYGVVTVLKVLTQLFLTVKKHILVMQEIPEWLPVAVVMFWQGLSLPYLHKDIHLLTVPVVVYLFTVVQVMKQRKFLVKHLCCQVILLKTSTKCLKI